jgi:hypothetical protein
VDHRPVDVNAIGLKSNGPGEYFETITKTFATFLVQHDLRQEGLAFRIAAPLTPECAPFVKNHGPDTFTVMSRIPLYVENHLTKVTFFHKKTNKISNESQINYK